MSAPQLPPYDHTPQAYEGPSAEEVLAMRREYLSPSLVLFYQKPIMIVEGKMQYVWDETGRRYLDGIGGIVTISVGHSHPYVVEKLNRQASLIHHTSPIYLNPNIAQYGKMLAEHMPGDLKVVYFVNSGSEANDLALLMARLYTGNYDVIGLRNGYHGGQRLGHEPDRAQHLEIQLSPQLRGCITPSRPIPTGAPMAGMIPRRARNTPRISRT